MGSIHCFTSATFSYLDRARVLAQTVKKFHPDWTLWLVLSDHEPRGFSFDVSLESFDGIIRLSDLSIPNLQSWIYCHNIVELCTAVKGPALEWLLKTGASKIIYLDPDIALFESLGEVVSLLDTHSLILTPHLTAPGRTRRDVVENEIGALKHGIYNLGFIAVSNGLEGQRFAEWWSRRLYDYCYEDVPSGLYTDQRWCDLIPAFFSNSKILHDPGYNVACWNLSSRPIKFEVDGTITAGGQALRFFHFTKINAAGEEVLQLFSGGRHEVFELVRWYREQIAMNHSVEIPNNWWAYGVYEDGLPISENQRRMYRLEKHLQEKFPDPFRSGSGSYQAWAVDHELF